MKLLVLVSNTFKPGCYGGYNVTYNKDTRLVVSGSGPFVTSMHIFIGYESTTTSMAESKRLSDHREVMARGAGPA